MPDSRTEALAVDETSARIDYGYGVTSDDETDVSYGVIVLLGDLLPPGAAELEAGFVHNWERDPFSCGAYSYVSVGHHGSARESLAKPLDDTLFFAGEATDTQGEAATVAGALQSGARAAREITISL